jgi:hypothetical protein
MSAGCRDRRPSGFRNERLVSRDGRRSRAFERECPPRWRRFRAGRQNQCRSRTAVPRPGGGPHRRGERLAPPPGPADSTRTDRASFTSSTRFRRPHVSSDTSGGRNCRGGNASAWVYREHSQAIRRCCRGRADGRARSGEQGQGARAPHRAGCFGRDSRSRIGRPQVAACFPRAVELGGGRIASKR